MHYKWIKASDKYVDVNMVYALSEKMAAVRKHLNVNLMDQPHTDIGRTEMQINANMG